MRSGRIYLSGGRLENYGASGYNWSSRAHPSNANLAYYLGFSAAGADPSSTNSRYYAFPSAAWQTSYIVKEG